MTKRTGERQGTQAANGAGAGRPHFATPRREAREPTRHGYASGALAMGRAANHAATAEPATATQAAMNASR